MAVTEVVRPKAPGRLRAGSALLGPAFVASIAYVDPGNVASNISAGARYGYLLVWVIVAANLMAVLVQYLSAKPTWTAPSKLSATPATRSPTCPEVSREGLLAGCQSR